MNKKIIVPDIGDFENVEIIEVLVKQGDEIKKNAIESRDYFRSLVCNENQLVYLKCGDFDKYGRLLGEIYIDKNDNGKK